MEGYHEEVRFPLSVPAVLTLALASMAATPPESSPVGNILDMEIVELPSAPAGHPCLEAWEGANAICDTLSEGSQECTDAESSAIKVCKKTAGRD